MSEYDEDIDIRVESIVVNEEDSNNLTESLVVGNKNQSTNSMDVSKN
jgi:hypothetical protein